MKRGSANPINKRTKNNNTSNNINTIINNHNSNSNIHFLTKLKHIKLNLKMNKVKMKSRLKQKRET